MLHSQHCSRDSAFVLQHLCKRFHLETATHTMIEYQIVSLRGHTWHTVHSPHILCFVFLLSRAASRSLAMASAISFSRKVREKKVELEPAFEAAERAGLETMDVAAEVHLAGATTTVLAPAAPPRQPTPPPSAPLRPATPPPGASS